MMWARAGMGLDGSRMARETRAPAWWAVRAVEEPTPPVGPKTMTLGEDMVVWVVMVEWYVWFNL
jgi:hypothetical protein